MYVFHFIFASVATRFVINLFGSAPRVEEALYLPTLVGTVTGTMAIALVTKPVIEDTFINLGRRIIRARDHET